MTVTSESYSAKGHSETIKFIQVSSINGFAEDIRATAEWDNGIIRTAYHDSPSMREIRRNTKLKHELEIAVRKAVTYHVDNCHEAYLKKRKRKKKVIAKPKTKGILPSSWL